MAPVAGGGQVFAGLYWPLLGVRRGFGPLLCSGVHWNDARDET
jgi:hypothetical protein